MKTKNLFNVSLKTALLIILTLSLTVINELKADYYYNSGDPSLPLNWGDLPGGGGAHPPDMTQNVFYYIGPGKTAVVTTPFHIRNLCVQTDGILQADAPLTVQVNGAFVLDSGGTYIHNNTSPAYQTILGSNFKNLKRRSNYIIRKWSSPQHPLMYGFDVNNGKFMYGNLEIDWTDGYGEWFHNMYLSLNFCDGDFKVTSTGSAILNLCAEGSLLSLDLTIKGDYIQTGGEVDLSRTSSIGYGNIQTTLHVYGSFIKTGGSLDGTGTFIAGCINLINNTNSTMTISNSGTLRRIIFKVTSQNGDYKLMSDFPLSSIFEYYVSFTCNDYSRFDFNTFGFTGIGTCRFGYSTYVKTAGVNGLNTSLRTTGRQQFLDLITFEYNGTSPQITGDSLPLNVYKLVINNSSNVTASKKIEIMNSINFLNGKLNINSFDVKLNPSCSVFNAGQNKFFNTVGSASLKKLITTIMSYVPVGNTKLNGVNIASNAADTFSFRVQNSFTNNPPDPSKAVNKEWTIAASNPAGKTVYLSLQWNTSDEAGSFNRAGEVSIGNWNSPSYLTKTAVTVPGPYADTWMTFYQPTVNFTGVSTTSKFVVGEDVGIIKQYYYAAGDPVSTNSWGDVPGGSGLHPTDFNVHAYFNVESGKTATVSTPMTLGNGNAALVIKNGAVLNSDAAITVNGNFILKNGATYNHNNNSIASATIFKGTETIEGQSTVNILKWSGVSDRLLGGVNSTFSANAYFGNLTINVHSLSGDWYQNFPGSYFLTKGDFRIQKMGTAVFIPTQAGNYYSEFFINGNFTIDSGCVVDMSKGSVKAATEVSTKLEVNKNLINRGTITATGNSKGLLWFISGNMHTIYNSGVMANLGTMSQPNVIHWMDSVKFLSNLNITGANSLFDVQGYLDLDNYGLGGDMNFQLSSTGKLKIKHPLGFDGAFTGLGYRNMMSGSNIEFNGTAPQITGTNYFYVLSNLKINNPEGVTFNGQLLIEDTLWLANGRVNSLMAPGASLQIDVNGVIKGASDSTFITGALGKVNEGMIPFVYPVGKNNKYRPFTFTPVSGGYIYFECEYFDTAYQYMIPLEDSLTGICESGYYNTSYNSGEYPAYNVTLSWKDDKVVTDMSKLRVAMWNGEGWYNIGNTGLTGSVQSGTVRSNPVHYTGIVAVGTTSGTLPQVTTVNVNSFIEGFYNSSANRMSCRDTLKAYLRNSNSPYAIVDSAKAIADSLTGNSKFSFRNTADGNYFLMLRHRNSIETWNKTAIAVEQGSVVNYDFTTAATQAFGNNMKQADASPLRFALYSGDVNQSGSVDLGDIVKTYNDASSFTTGYVSSDVTGDKITNLSDLTIVYNNSALFVSSLAP